MVFVLEFFRSSIGKKIVMAVTGVIFYGFVVGHMAGNLQVYLGREVMDHYGVFLREILHGAGLWIARATLFVSLILHVWSAYSLTRDNAAARPLGYRERQNLASTFASRSMRWSGLLLLIFIIYHLLHFTVGTVHPSFEEGKVFHNFITGFKQLWASIFYMLATIGLGFHMYHGGWSMLQTLGLNHPKYNKLRYAFAVVITAAVVLGNLSFPIAVLAGFIHE
jgi:succinate dehydrogenase / fumarate reductase cytochrome b subunit